MNEVIVADNDKIDLFDFIRGQHDCREGVPHKSGMSESYDRGYSAEYQLEQIQGNGYGLKKAV
jgi:hypothetical protein